MQYTPHAIAVFLALLLGSAVDENRMLKDENTQLSTRVQSLADTRGVSHCPADEAPAQGDVFLAHMVEFSATPSFE